MYLTRRGSQVAAVVDASFLDALLEAAEDLADIEAAKAAIDEMEQTNKTPVPWEKVKVALGHRGDIYQR